MKTFRFESILLLSRREKKARSITFHRNRNLILGANHTGKSSLIRALFETLGAMPQGRLEAWDENVVSLLRFTVDDRPYYAVRQRNNRGLFNAGGELIAATSTASSWADEFSRITGFNLTFSDKKGEAVPADPSCFFLPFYVNQDGSWQASWSTFRGMQRYSSPWGAILEYFSGICPPEYYSVKAERDQEAALLEDMKHEDRLLERARARFGRSATLTGPKIESGNFDDEISRLTVEVNALNAEQEKLRERAVKEQELLSSLRQQIAVANEALRTHDKDAEYLQKDETQTLICPTCKAEHARSFLDLLIYTEDARVVRDIVTQLRDDENRIVERYRKTQANLGQLTGNYRRVSQILSARRGDLKFRDVVESMGAERAFAAFEAEAKALKKMIDDRTAGLVNMDRQLKELRSPKKAKAIVEEFRNRYASAREALHLQPVATSKIRLTSRPDLSGSGGPRSILAYYAAIWQICNESLAAFSVPVVIDSPNQQAQDSVNLPAVIKFIARDLSTSTQLIVGLESGTEYAFDKEINLDRPYGFLDANEWDSAENVAEPFVRKMLDNLASAANRLI